MVTGYTMEDWSEKDYLKRKRKEKRKLRKKKLQRIFNGKKEKEMGTRPDTKT